jgi:Fe-S cluster assembly protein SufD
MGAFDRVAAAALFAATEPLPWLAAHRDAARSEWQQAAWPTRKTEAWKYTSLEPLAESAWLRVPGSADPAALRDAALIEGLDADYLVFVNGRFAPDLSSVTADPATTVCSFADANPAQRELIRAHLGACSEGTANPFVALNGCWMHDGALLHVARGRRAARPLCVVRLGDPGSSPAAWAERLLVVLEEQAEASLVEYFPALPFTAPGLVTGVTEIVLGRGARLAHQRLQCEDERLLHIGGIYADLAADASYTGFVLAQGSRLKRIDLRLRHRGTGSECRLDGVYLARNTQHVDLHTTVEHDVERGTTRQVYRGIVDDAARAVFNGRILIRPGAQKTNADLSNRNLLFSDRAEIDTKPELEIYADDVKCSHGATVSRIEERNLYYLQSRGIARSEAEVLLAFGFINELFGAIGSAPLEALLRAQLRGWFGAALPTLGVAP